MKDTRYVMEFLEERGIKDEKTVRLVLDAMLLERTHLASLTKPNSCPRCGAKDYEQWAEWYLESWVTGHSHTEYQCSKCQHKWNKWTRE